MNYRNLKELNLRGNAIFNIEQGVFNILNNLNRLDVSFNLLTTFDFSILPNASKISVTNLILVNNKLTSLKFRSNTRHDIKSNKISISIGGNVISREALKSMRILYNQVQLYSLIPDFYNKNVNKMTCVETDTGSPSQYLGDYFQDFTYLLETYINLYAYRNDDIGFNLE